MKRRTLFPLIVMLAAMLACVVPGQAPVPVSSDPGTIATIVVATAEAAASQTAAPLQPDTGQPLVTGEPSVAVEPPGTAVPRQTGTGMEEQPDGTTRYSDFDAGFEVVYPVGWLAVRPNTDEFNAARGNEADDNPGLEAQMADDLAGYEAPYDRVFSYILRPDLQQDALFGFSKLVWDPVDTKSLDDATMGELVQGMESSGLLPGFRADTAQVRENGNGVSMIEIGGRFAWSDGEGGTIPLYVTYIFFKPSPGSLSRMTFTVLQDYNTEISPEVKSIIESIKRLYPYE